jgi:hypothetical protein
MVQQGDMGRKNEKRKKYVYTILLDIAQILEFKEKSFFLKRIGKIVSLFP